MPTGWQAKADWVTNPRNPTWQDLQNLVLDQGRAGVSSWGGDIDAGQHKLTNLSGITGLGGTGTLSLNANGGNVGIGTGYPQLKLEVNGGLQVDDRGDNYCAMARMISGHTTWDLYSIQGTGAFQFYGVTNSIGGPGPGAVLQLSGIGHVLPMVPPYGPNDGDIPNSHYGAWYDEANSRLVFRVRSSTGVLKTGYVSVA